MLAVDGIAATARHNMDIGGYGFRLKAGTTLIELLSPLGRDEGNAMTALPAVPLPPTIRSRVVENINGLSMHVLEAGFETKGRRCLLLLHGFPELAFSWRK